MKQQFFRLAMLAVIASLLFSLTGCEKPQSELNLDTLKETAIVSGQILYDAGVNVNGSDYSVNRIVPVKDIEIYVEVNYSEYDINSATSDNKGKKIFETKTDSTGCYSIEIPVWSEGIKADIRMKEFTATKSEYLKMESGKPVFKTDLYVYSYTQNNVLLKPGRVEFFDRSKIMCTAKKLSPDAFGEQITIKGNVQIAYEKEYLEGAYKAGANTTINFNATYILEDGSPLEVNYGAQTNDNGDFKVTIPMQSRKQGFKLTITEEGLATTFTHYTAPGVKTTLKGAYKSSNIVTNLNWQNIMSVKEVDLNTIYLKFDPRYNHNLTFNPLPSEWFDGITSLSLPGWERYNGFTNTVTISGKMVFAEEIGFREGTFNNSFQTAILRVMYNDALRADNTLIIKTDAEGNFKFDLPASDDKEKISLFLLSIPNNDFKHYISPSQTMKVNGKYNFIVQNNNDAKWNELGTLYALFVPNTIPTNWDNNLAGWRVFNDKKVAKTIEANVLVPKENSYGIGTYVPANDILMEVTVEHGSSIEKYNTVVNNGKLNTTIYVDEDNTIPTIRITAGTKNEVNNFVHFTGKGTETKRLTGYYNDYKVGSNYYGWEGEKEEKRISWNKLGDIFLQFNPSTYEPTYTQDLTGWVKRPGKSAYKNITFKCNDASRNPIRYRCLYKSKQYDG